HAVWECNEGGINKKKKKKVREERMRLGNDRERGKQKEDTMEQCDISRLQMAAIPPHNRAPKSGQEGRIIHSVTYSHSPGTKNLECWLGLWRCCLYYCLYDL